jgi:RND superfamily putative drug exporter
VGWAKQAGLVGQDDELSAVASSDQGNNPASTTTRQAYDLLAGGFGPGFNGPLLLVAQTRTQADVAALRTLEAERPGWPT